MTSPSHLVTRIEKLCFHKQPILVTEHNLSNLDTTRLSFLDFPGEVRNKIYRLVLVKADPVAIRDLACVEYEEQRGKGLCKRRTAYRPRDHKHGKLKTLTPPWTLLETTYCLDTTSTLYLDQLSGWEVGFFDLNRQIRNESMTIFYSENTFLFWNISAVLPFLQDRPPAARLSIESIALLFSFGFVYRGTLKSPHHATLRIFERTCSKLADGDYTNIKRLFTIIDDYRPLCFGGDSPHTELRFRDEILGWASRLKEVVNKLDQFGIYYTRRWAGPRPDAFEWFEMLETMNDKMWDYFTADLHDKLTRDTNLERTFKKLLIGHQRSITARYL